MLKHPYGEGRGRPTPFALARRLGYTQSAMKQVGVEKKQVDELTVRDLEELIRRIVRQAIREETSSEFYVNDQGLRVRFEEEAIDPKYLAELQRHYEDLRSGRTKLIAGAEVLKKLRRSKRNV